MFTNEEQAMFDEIREKAIRERQMGMKLIENTNMLSEMNLKQVMVMKQILLDIPYFDFYNSDKYEVKTLEMKMTDYGDVYVVIETGMVDDEGTIASILCRKRRHFFIGIRGGIKIVNSKYHLSSVSRFKLMNSYYEH